MWFAAAARLIHRAGRFSSDPYFFDKPGAVLKQRSTSHWQPLQTSWLRQTGVMKRHAVICTATLSLRGGLMAKMTLFLLGFLALTLTIGMLATIPPG
ncbi:hypothetical protein [Pseudomonas sp. NFACC02]|uniref:hypothetical protein n=1 Tax=Pseudomonas sp. NFACC02 TaxID=1566250 RepID=UPI00111353CA|nr:hypothetical protein [Pseudomonas sp. NFACC02]